MSEYPKTMYKVQGGRIESVEVIKETKSFVRVSIPVRWGSKDYWLSKKAEGPRPHRVCGTIEEAEEAWAELMN